MFCSKCGTENVNEANFCKSCGATIRQEIAPLATQVSDSTIVTEVPLEIQYASFWRRGAAYIVDWQIVSLGFATVIARLTKGESDNVQLVGYGVLAFFIMMYFSVSESRDAATIGKKLFHLHVLRADQSKLSFARALGRFLGRWISAIILGIGYFMQPFTAKRQALHDMMTDSVVVQTKKGRNGLVIAAWVFQILLLVVTAMVVLNSRAQAKEVALSSAESGVHDKLEDQVTRSSNSLVQPEVQNTLHVKGKTILAEVLQKTSVRIHPMEGKKSLSVRCDNGVCEVNGTCGNSRILIAGITNAFDNIFQTSSDKDSVIFVGDEEFYKYRALYSGDGVGALSDFNGMACVPTAAGERLLIWSNCGGSSCGDEYHFYVIDTDNFTYLLKYGDAQAASRFLNSRLPYEIH